MAKIRFKSLLELYIHQEGLCAYCQLPIRPKTVTIEHVIPRSWKGAREPYNTALVCLSCQQEKNRLENIIARDHASKPSLEKCAHFIVAAMVKAQRDSGYGPRRGLFRAMAENVCRCADERFRFST